MKSLRRFLLVALLTTITLMAILEGVWSHRQGMHEIDEVFDAQLAQYARTLLGLIDHAGGQAGLVALQQRLSDTEKASHTGAHHPYESQLGFQIWRAQGELLGHSASLPARQLVPLQAGYHGAELAGQDWLFFTLYDNKHQRWVVAGQSARVRTELASRFALHDIATAIALVLALGFAVLLIMRMALAPLDKLAWQVSQRDEHDLRSVDSSELPLELQALADAINSAFGRLQKAFDREKQFTNDAAHELRTPVAIIQTQLENSLATADADSGPALESALAATRSLGQLISQLLELARLSPQSQRASYQAINLYSLVREQIGSSLAAIDARQLRVSLAGDENAMVAGNSRLLSVMVRNLLDNAIKYTPEGGRIEASIDRVGGVTGLSISDTGPGIPVALRHSALQRFYRLPAQQADSGVSGCGLGLALVDMIAQLHGASLSLSDATGGGLLVTLRFSQLAQQRVQSNLESVD